MKKYLFTCCVLWQIQVYAQPPQEIFLHCPPADQLLQKPLSNGHGYQYSTYVSLNLPQLNNQLYMAGSSSSAKADYFSGATWTDMSFLCLYNLEGDPIILFDTQLGAYVQHCYFKNGTDSPKDECLYSDPQQCYLTCEIND